MTDPNPAAPSDTLEGNVTRLEYEGKEIFLVGTAHVSRQSVEEVRRVVSELRPSAVCVELDAARYETLADETRWERVDVRTTLAEGRAGLFLASLLFSGFQKRLGDKLGVKPGAEMLAAVEAARSAGAEVVLADREVQATLMRCYRSLPFFERAQILVVLAMLPFAASDIDEAQVEELKSRKAMGDVMETFAKQMPALKVPLIDERDQYLIARTRAAPGTRIVSVVGAAHVQGMTRALGAVIDCDALSVLPTPPSKLRRPALALSVLLGLSVAVAQRHGAHALPGALASVAVPAAVLATLFALVGGAHVLTSLAAGVLAPVSLFLPARVTDRFVGFTELRLRPRRAGDGVRLRDDVLAPRRARKNSMLRPILAATFASAGARIGALGGLLRALIGLI